MLVNPLPVSHVDGLLECHGVVRSSLDCLCTRSNDQVNDESNDSLITGCICRWSKRGMWWRRDVILEPGSGVATSSRILMRCTYFSHDTTLRFTWTQALQPGPGSLGPWRFQIQAMKIPWYLCRSRSCNHEVDIAQEV